MLASGVSDIRPLNQLKKLKEVNLAGNRIDEKTINNQLDHPEIAVFYGLHAVHFRIWERDY